MRKGFEKYGRYVAKENVPEWNIKKGQETTLSKDEYKAKKDLFDPVTAEKKSGSN